MRQEHKQFPIYAALVAALLALLLVALASCKQQQPSSSGRVKPLPKVSEAVGSSVSPELLRAEKVGDDTRYVISYNGTEFCIVAGEKGIFGIKVVAPADAQRWTSLWLDFYPGIPRPRPHTIGEISTRNASLDYIAEDYRSYVFKAKELAAKLAPQDPQVGEAAKSPRAARLKLKGLDLPPVAANELAIFARTNNFMVRVNEIFPARSLPGKVETLDGGEIRLSQGSSALGFSPNASWAHMKLGIKLYETNLLIIKRDSGFECYLDFSKYRGSYVDLEAIIKFDSGLVGITRFDPVKPGDEKLIGDEYRRMSGMMLALLDSQLFEPPQELKRELLTALTAINQKDTAHSYAHMKERKGGVEDILLSLGRE